MQMQTQSRSQGNIFSFLHQRVKNGDQLYQYYSMIIKGVSFKQQLQWDPSRHHLQGFMDFSLGKLDADEMHSPQKLFC